MDTGIVLQLSVGSQKSTDSHYSRNEHMPSTIEQNNTLNVDGHSTFVVLSPKSNNVIEIRQNEYCDESPTTLGKKEMAKL